MLWIWLVLLPHAAIDSGRFNTVGLKSIKGTTLIVLVGPVCLFCQRPESGFLLLAPGWWPVEWFGSGDYLGHGLGRLLISGVYGQEPVSY